MAILRRATVKPVEANAPEPMAEQVEPPALTLPAIPLDGSRWDEGTHNLAVKVYEAALTAGDPDAGRMRTLLGMYGHLGSELHTGAAGGVKFKG